VLYQLSYFRISKLYSRFSPAGCIAVSNTGANIYRFFKSPNTELKKIFIPTLKKQALQM
jgi:hypothetical protein